MMFAGVCGQRRPTLMQAEAVCSCTDADGNDCLDRARSQLGETQPVNGACCGWH